MQILIIRHAIAEDRETFARTGESDDRRPLTEKGRSRMRKAAAGLKRLIEIDMVAHSPLVRAVQTAEILKSEFPATELAEVPELAPGKGAESLAHWLGFVSRKATVALVGHEPDLSEFVAWLTTGAPRSFISLKKGGAVLLECQDQPGPGSATLLWALPPAYLRYLSGAK